MPSAPAIGFEYRPSRTLQLAFPVMGVLAALTVLHGGLAWWIETPLIAAQAVWLVIERRRFRHSSVHAAVYHGDGSWALRLSGGASVEATLASHRALGGLMVLQFSWEGGRAALLLLPDNLDGDMRRRLRMRMRFCRAASEPA
jgi:toxin CptA